MAAAGRLRVWGALRKPSPVKELWDGTRWELPRCGARPVGLRGQFVITALLTIYHYKDGVFGKYQGATMKTDFINFIKDQEWKSTEPVSSWFHPSFYL